MTLKRGMRMTDFLILADDIVSGKRISDDTYEKDFTQGDLKGIMQGADHIREALCGKKIDLCSIINGRSGRCPENCRFCAQSAHSHTGAKEYPFLSPDEIVSDCMKYEKKGVDRYSIVTAGRTLEGADLDTAAEAYRLMHEKCPSIKLCASHGLLTEEAFKRLKDAGADMYHCNIETSEHYFPSICTSHTFADKLREIKLAKEAGFSICCGGIIGMGESWKDRYDMALTLSRLDITSIPINVLIPVKGTPLEHQAPISNEDILRTVAIFRFLNPSAFIRIAAGRKAFRDGGCELFHAGANATITGDMLTTTGNDTSEDRKMFAEMGFIIKDEVTGND